MKRRLLAFGIAVIFLSVSGLDLYGSIDSLRIVVIDAGHGDHDPGAVGKISKEKDVALRIALKLGNYIEKNIPGVKVVYTRKTDVFVELWRRADIANKAGADLFISIHCNAAKSTRAYGTETFAMGLHKSAANLEVARKENASILLEDNFDIKYEGFDPNSAEAYTLFSLFQNAFLDQSLDLAARVQYQFRERAGRHDRGVKQAGFLVLWRTSMPGILVETGFLSNPEEEKFLASEQGQDYIASALYRAFRDYKKDIDQDAAEYARAFGGMPEPKVVKERPEPEKVEAVPVAEVPGPRSDPEPEPEITEAPPAVDAILEPEVYFSVQFLTSSQARDPGDPAFRGLDGVWSYQHNGLFKYVVGKETNLMHVVELQSRVQALGFTDAFLVAFNKGERISVKEANLLLSQGR